MTNRRGIELFARDYPHDYPEVEAILMLHAHRLRIHEVPVRMNARGFGRSSIDYPRSAYYMAKVLLALFVGLFRRRPTPLDDGPIRPRAAGCAGRAGRRSRRRAGGAMSTAVSWLPLAAAQLDSRVQIVAVIVTAILLGVVLELVRRRRLVERYALLWMLVAVALLVLAIWTSCSTSAADLLGISRCRPTPSSSPPSASPSCCSCTSRSPSRGSPRRPRSSPRRSRGSTRSCGRRERLGRTVTAPASGGTERPRAAGSLSPRPRAARSTTDQ